MTAQLIPETQSLQHTEREALKQTFDKDGFFVIKNVVSSAKLAELHRSLDTEFQKGKASGALFNGGGMMSGHLNCFPGEGARLIYETLCARGIIDLIKELHPQANQMPNVGCNYNLPHSVPQHYHTDRDFTRDFMICNIAVVDTVIENGAMEIIPGTHKEYYKYWQFVTKGITRNSMRLPMKQGDVVVRTSNVWHRGMPNLTSVPRPMLAFTWEDGGSTQPDPFAVEEGKITFRPNWFRPTRLGRIREQLFVKVPLSYSGYRFATSLYSKKGY